MVEVAAAVAAKESSSSLADRPEIVSQVGIISDPCLCVFISVVFLNYHYHTHSSCSVKG